MVIREGDRTRVQAFQGNVIAGRYRDDKVPNPGSTLSFAAFPTELGSNGSFPTTALRLSRSKLLAAARSAVQSSTTCEALPVATPASRSDAEFNSVSENIRTFRLSE